MLGQRRRRWTNIEPTMAQCLVFAGLVLGGEAIVTTHINGSVYPK